MYICICIYINVCIDVYIIIYIHMYVYVYICEYVCMCISAPCPEDVGSPIFDLFVGLVSFYFLFSSIFSNTQTLLDLLLNNNRKISTKQKSDKGTHPPLEGMVSLYTYIHVYRHIYIYIYTYVYVHTYIYVYI